MNDRLQSEPYAAPRHHESDLVAEAWLSDCCAAECRIEQSDYTVCRETGYREGGDAVICTACRKETEESLQPVITARWVEAAPSKISRQQGDLDFEKEVA